MDIGKGKSEVVAVCIDNRCSHFENQYSLLLPMRRSLHRYTPVGSDMRVF